MKAPHASVEEILAQIKEELAGEGDFFDEGVITLRITRAFACEWLQAASLLDQCEVVELRQAAKDATMPADDGREGYRGEDEDIE